MDGRKNKVRRAKVVELNLTKYTLTFATIAASVGKWIASDAEGSGIPEMKAILSGINLYRYLGF